MHHIVSRPEFPRFSSAAKKQAPPSIEPESNGAPTHGEIARVAYAIYVKSGRQPGQCEANWHEAELQLQEARQKQQAELDMQSEGGLPPAPDGHGRRTEALVLAIPANRRNRKLIL